MKFYQENKINPLASLYPVAGPVAGLHHLFQAPAALLREDICGQTAVACSQPDPGPDRRQSRHSCALSFGESFLFIPDLTDKATGGVLIALLCSLRRNPADLGRRPMTTGDRNQRMLMLALPFIFVPSSSPSRPA